MVDNTVAVLAVGATALIVYLVTNSRWSHKLAEFRKASATAQRATLRGQMAERVASMFPQFTWNPSDAHFLGQPVDYVIFDGLTDNRDGISSRPVEIVFVEAKSGSQTLTAVEKLVQQAVQERRVRHLVPLRVAGE